jgi:hypothetical protein
MNDLHKVVRLEQALFAGKHYLIGEPQVVELIYLFFNVFGLVILHQQDDSVNWPENPLKADPNTRW